MESVRRIRLHFRKTNRYKAGVSAPLRLHSFFFSHAGVSVPFTLIRYQFDSMACA
jgi:hypothetical protein